MTIEELEEYKGIASEIQALKYEIETMYEPISSPNGNTDGGHSSTPGNPTASAVDRILEKKEELRETLVKSNKKLQAIDSWLQTVNDSELRAIIRWHYIIGFDWRKTCLRVYGYPSYGSCKMRVRRYFGLS